MKIESHIKHLNESFDEIELAVTRGIESRQRTLAFHAFAAAVDMLEIILHKKNLIDPGFIIKHHWFNSTKVIEEKFDFDFPKKNEILKLMQEIELMRNPFCYGRRRDEEELRVIVDKFKKLREIFTEVYENEL